MLKNRIFIRYCSYLTALTSSHVALAACPLCTLAVGIGVGFSRRLGVDDTITGLWIGALIVSTIAWTVNFLTRHGIKFMGRKPLVAGAYLFLFLWPLYHYAYIGIPGNILWGYDKLLLGIIVGIVTFILVTILYSYQKAHNGGHAYFPFQKIVMAVGLLALMSTLFYCITKG